MKDINRTNKKYRYYTFGCVLLPGSWLMKNWLKGTVFFFPSPLTYRTDRAKGRDGEKTTTHAGYKICTIIQPIELQTPIEHHFHLTFFFGWGWG